MCGGEKEGVVWRGVGQRVWCGEGFVRGCGVEGGGSDGGGVWCGEAMVGAH
jgi:hypothetical protein